MKGGDEVEKQKRENSPRWEAEALQEVLCKPWRDQDVDAVLTPCMDTKKRWTKKGGSMWKLR